jgi:hypothetical protein
MRFARPLPPPDLVIEILSDNAMFILAPCHQRAADWLRVSVGASGRWVGEGVAVEHQALDHLVAGAVGAGLAVGFPFRRQTRINSGHAAAADVR